MANNYLQFSEELSGLSQAEHDWLARQLEIIEVFDGVEFPEDDSHRPPSIPEYQGPRIFRGDTDGGGWDFLQFQYELTPPSDDRNNGELWIFAEESGDPDQAARIVQKFLKQFRPDGCWALSYACTCSKPRIREFGGGAVFVTADAIRYDSSAEFLEREEQAFAQTTLHAAECK